MLAIYGKPSCAEKAGQLGMISQSTAEQIETSNHGNLRDKKTLRILSIRSTSWELSGSTASILKDIDIDTFGYQDKIENGRLDEEDQRCRGEQHHWEKIPACWLRPCQIS
jgi:hypothetical protein